MRGVGSISMMYIFQHWLPHETKCAAGGQHKAWWPAYVCSSVLYMDISINQCHETMLGAAWGWRIQGMCAICKHVYPKDDIHVSCRFRSIKYYIACVDLIFMDVVTCDGMSIHAWSIVICLSICDLSLYFAAKRGVKILLEQPASSVSWSIFRFLIPKIYRPYIYPNRWGIVALGTYETTAELAWSKACYVFFTSTKILFGFCYRRRVAFPMGSYGASSLKMTVHHGWKQKGPGVFRNYIYRTWI